MAWNGSGDTGRARTPSAPQKKSGASSPLWLKGALAGLVVVAIGAAVLYMLRPEEKPVEKPKAPAKSAAIKPVVPAAAPTNAAPQVAKKKYADDPPGTVRNERGEITKGWVTLPNGTRHYRSGLKKVQVGPSKRAAFAIFDHTTDNEFAALLSLKPGQGLIGGPMLHGGDYKKAFLESLKTPIIVKSEDSESDKELKYAVIEARKQMKEALDKGEDIQKIVEDSYEEASRLARYSDEIRDMVNKLLKQDDLTDADMKDLETAANAMLESKGIGPMKFGVITRARVKALRGKNKQSGGK